MRLILISVLACLVFSSCDGDPVNNFPSLKNIVKMKIYDVEGIRDSYDNLELGVKSNKLLDQEIVTNIFENLKFKDKDPLWKGSSLAIITMKDGSEKLLAFSYYGYFFKIINEKGTYYLEGKSKIIFENTWNDILKNDFIPNRKN